jgi:hypothetical protein
MNLIRAGARGMVGEEVEPGRHPARPSVLRPSVHVRNE